MVGENLRFGDMEVAFEQWTERGRVIWIRYAGWFVRLPKCYFSHPSRLQRKFPPLPGKQYK
ncbi:MAG TPA: hypothetical protein DDY31_17625 [Lachnospiraceae bacterium]|nr:hypothetical protein [Lachnospiraceae bacterium]